MKTLKISNKTFNELQKITQNQKKIGLRINELILQGKSNQQIFDSVIVDYPKTRIQYNDPSYINKCRSALRIKVLKVA